MKNNSLLFSPDSDTDLFVATLLLVVLLALTMGPALSELAAWRVDVAVGVTALVGLPALANLLRYKRAPWGCAVLPLGFACYGIGFLLGRPGIECAALLGLPNVGFLSWEVALKPLGARLRARAALRDLDGERDAAGLAVYLSNAASVVRERAASLIGARPLEEALGALGPVLRGPSPGREAAAEASLLLAGGALPAPLARELEALLAESDPHVAAVAAGLVGRLDAQRAEALADDARPEVRLALARGLILAGRAPALAARLLAQVLADEALDPELRVTALDSTDAPSAEPSAIAALGAQLPSALGTALASGSLTPELLWACAEHGRSQDAPRIAAGVGRPNVAVGNAALEALEGILNRGVSLGEHTAATREALASGREALRAEHPLGENRLADGLVARAEAVERGLAG